MARGVASPGPDEEFDYLALAGVLAQPDEEMPPDLIEALYLIAQLGTEDHFSDLLKLAADNSIDTSDEATPQDLAVQIWLDNPKALERLGNEDAFHRRKSFVSLRAADPSQIMVVEDLPTDLAPLERDLEVYFAAKRSGLGPWVTRVDCSGEIRFLVQHGQPCTRKASRKGVQSTRTFYRPEKTDIVACDFKNFELRVNSPSAPDIRKYRELFGLHLFGNSETFVYAEKYTLEPLKRAGEAALRCRDIEGIESVDLVQVEWDLGDGLDDIYSRRSIDIFRMFALRNDGIPQNAHIRQAVFRVKLESEKKARLVSVIAGNKAGYHRGEEFMLKEEWLKVRGFILLGTTVTYAEVA